MCGALACVAGVAPGWSRGWLRALCRTWFVLSAWDAGVVCCCSAMPFACHPPLSQVLLADKRTAAGAVNGAR